MGIIASYQYLSDANLQELKSFYAEEDDIFEEVEDWNDEAEILLDIDKMWDALHFVLTGVSCIEPIKNNSLSEAVVGVLPIDGIEEYISYIEKSRIKDIVFALDNFDIEKALKIFSMKECKEAELYPDIWDYDEEVEEIKDELLHDFEQMKRFYKQVLDANGNVLVSIC